jgi:hypothetical protein
MTLIGRKDGKKHEKDGYQALWRKVKLPETPDSGIPFDTEDAMFNPPTPHHMSAQVVPDHAPLLEPLGSSESTHQDDTWPPAGLRHTLVPSKPEHAPHPSKNRVIPVEEDIRRLFQECRVARGNASVLVQSLRYAKPQDLEKEINQVCDHLLTSRCSILTFCTGVLHQMSGVPGLYCRADPVGHDRCRPISGETRDTDQYACPTRAGSAGGRTHDRGETHR